MTYEYKATVLSVHDGDTFTCLLDLGLFEYRRLNIRLFGINAPELKTSAGPPSRDHLIGLLGTPFVPIIVRTIRDQPDKYGGRWDGKVWLVSDGTWGADNEFVVAVPSINERMIADGQAVKYP